MVGEGKEPKEEKTDCASTGCSGRSGMKKKKVFAFGGSKRKN